MHSTWYRAVDPKFLGSALSTSHTASTPSRFSPGRPGSLSYEILYLAENPMVALFEARALFGSPALPGGVVPNPGRALVTLPIVADLSSVVDLTDSVQASVIDTNAQELTGDWRSYALRTPPEVTPAPHTGLAPTHSLGQALFALGRHQAIISFSSTLPDYKILVVFPERLKGTSNYLQYSYHDERGFLRIRKIS